MEAQRLATAPDNPAVIAIARRALRGPIEDRNGQWLARSDRDANGEATREYRDDTISHVVGYASRRYGTAGLERTYNAQLLGLPGRGPRWVISPASSARRPDRRLGLRLSLDLRLQRAAVRALGKDKGAVVMLDPATGEILALASTPVYDASAIADPDTATATFERLPGRRRPAAAAARHAGPLRAGLRVQDRDRRSPASTPGAIDPARRSRSSRRPRRRASWSSGFRIRDGHHPETGDTALDLTGATEVSCNIWYALAGLATGGDRLVERGRASSASAASIPFDLPTAISRVTSGDGQAPGGFTDDAELASASFGQGETFVTPLQMALVASTVANDGVLMRPHARDGAHRRRARARAPIGPRAWRRVMCEADARALQAAMQQAVEGELGRQFTPGAKVAGVPTAGKSGTAELGGKGEPHSWFIGFAPVENPQVAIAVLVERGGRGGERAAPLAGALMERYFELYGKPVMRPERPAAPRVEP